MEAQFIALLDRLTPKPERMKLIDRLFPERWDGLVQESASESLALRQQLGKLEARKQRILLQMADGAIAEEDFAQLRASTAASIGELRSQFAVMEGSELDQETSLAFVQHLLWNSSAIWQTASLLEKQRLQRRIFPSGLVLDKTGVGTPVTHSIYTL